MSRRVRGLALLCAALAWCPAGLAASPRTGVPAEAPARRIVSLAPHLTELAYAAGAGPSLVGTVAYSDHPAPARALPRVGDAYRIDFERLLALRPDLVLVWPEGTPAGVREQLAALGLRSVAVATGRLDAVPGALRRIGALAGSVEPAEHAARDYTMRLAALRRTHGGRAQRSAFIQIGDRPLFTVNARHVISEVVAICGGRNVFADLPQLAPPVALEAVLAADPELILVLDDVLPRPLAHWQRWPQLRAVRAGAVYPLPADLLARSTPRILDGLAATCARLAPGARSHDRGSESALPQRR